MRFLRVDSSDSTPIWSQIAEGLRRLVASGALEPGGAVASVRELARDLSVNPATVAKAYQRLTDDGVLTVRRGEGTYVSEKPPVFPRRERECALQEAATRYASVARMIGADITAASGALSSAWRQLGDGSRPGGKKP